MKELIWVCLVLGVAQGCKEAVDILFLVDGSNGVSSSDFMQETAFVSTQTMEYHIGQNDARIGIISFSDTAWDYVNFKESENEEQFASRVTSVQKPKGDLIINNVLNAAHEFIEKEGRKGSRKVLVLVTSGRSRTMWESFRKARQMRREHILIYAIGVGHKISRTELMGITGDINNVINVDTFHSLFSLSSKLHELICPGYNEPSSLVIQNDPYLFKANVELSVISNAINKGLSPLLPQRYHLIDNFTYAKNNPRQRLNSIKPNTANTAKKYQTKEDPKKPKQDGLKPFSTKSTKKDIESELKEIVQNTINEYRQKQKKVVVNSFSNNRQMTSLPNLPRKDSNKNDISRRHVTSSSKQNDRRFVKSRINNLDNLSFNLKQYSLKNQKFDKNEIQNKESKLKTQGRKMLKYGFIDDFIHSEIRDKHIRQNEKAQIKQGVQKADSSKTQKPKFEKFKKPEILKLQLQTLEKPETPKLQLPTIEKPELSKLQLPTIEKPEIPIPQLPTLMEPKTTKEQLQKIDKPEILKVQLPNIEEHQIPKIQLPKFKKPIFVMNEKSIWDKLIQQHEPQVTYRVVDSKKKDNKTPKANEDIRVTYRSDINQEVPPPPSIFQQKSSVSLDQMIGHTKIDKGILFNARSSYIENQSKGHKPAENKVKTKNRMRIADSEANDGKSNDGHQSKTKGAGPRRTSNGSNKSSELGALRKTLELLTMLNKNFKIVTTTSTPLTTTAPTTIKTTTSTPSTTTSTTTIRPPIAAQSKSQRDKNTEIRKGRPVDETIEKGNTKEYLKTFKFSKDVKKDVTLLLDLLMFEHDKMLKRKKKRKEPKKTKSETSTTATEAPRNKTTQTVTTTPAVLWKKVNFQENLTPTLQSYAVQRSRDTGKARFKEDWNFRRPAHFRPGSEIKRQYLSESSLVKSGDKQTDQENCNLLPYRKDSSFYIEKTENRTVLRPCPEGTAFDIQSCACTIMTIVRSLQGCSPEVLLDFTSDTKDKSGKNIHVGAENIELSNGSAVFRDKADITIWRFTGSHIGRQLMIQVRFKAFKDPEQRQFVVSNCNYGTDISFGIEIDRINGVVIFVLDTEPREKKEIKIPFDLDNWTTAIFLYDGISFTGIVNGKKQSTSLAGDVETRSSPLRIGGCGGKANKFTGMIDEVSMSFCIPKQRRG